MGIIIGTFEEFEIGKRVSVGYLNDSERKPHFNVPFLVLKEVTREDYVKYCLETNAKSFYESTSKNYLDPRARFYEISMD